MTSVRFGGTAIAATISVRRMAANAFGSFSAAKYASTPCRKASTNTAASGRAINSSMKPSASAISSSLTASGSSVERMPEAIYFAARAPDQRCNKLITKSMMNEATSMTQASAVAPGTSYCSKWVTISSGTISER